MCPDAGITLCHWTIDGGRFKRDVSRQQPEPQSMEKEMTQHTYVGMWVTDGGYIRHELLPNGRYDEARGTRKSAYQGRYEIKGNHIDYWDDTGFTADGKFVDEHTLHHGGMIFRRQ
jgi:Agrobacterium tumefaciens protein Atu4866